LEVLRGGIVPENPHSDRDALLSECQSLRARLEVSERARQRAELLSEASAILFESLDHKVVLERLARLVVRSFADWCVIDLVEDGEIQRVAGAHADPQKQPVLEDLRRRFPPRWDSPHPAVKVLRSGQPLAFPEVSDEDMRRLTEGEEHMRLGVVLGVRSGMVVPLIARERVLGALTVGSGHPERRYGQDDVDLILALARRAAVAIENALLHHQSQEAVRLRDEFLSVASHELNTPMAALMLSLEGLGTEDPELQLDRAGMVHVAGLAERQGRRLTKLINDLLDVTRLSRGALELHREDVELCGLVREVVARYKPELERAGCEVTLDLPGPAVGRWDPMRLDQVVLNLLANAAKFGAHKPITIRVETAGDRVRLSVIDRGMGIDPTQQERIFERFERGVASRHYGGLGLGLYICRRIVDSHGGTIAVRSALGHGATFTVELPCHEPEGIS
jgi:signal transduction histidine kinase